MKIRITTASPDELHHDTLILGVFSDERPPRGYGGWVDWRLNGVISAEIARGKISGRFPDKLLYAYPQRIRVSRLLLFGMGPLAELTYDRLYNTGYEMARTLSGIQTTDMALPMPAAGRGSLKLPEMTDAMVTGLFDGFALKPEELPALHLEIPVKATQTEEIVKGMTLFRQRVGETVCEILFPEQGADEISIGMASMTKTGGPTQ
ncbi:MAG: M17 family peptidase N-terminal domain-containing protein [Syntrophales bacterium]|nr:M17 family peptidase N-terminal domain-containing protein [Syntrophales bacterium]